MFGGLLVHPLQYVIIGGDRAVLVRNICFAFEHRFHELNRALVGVFATDIFCRIDFDSYDDSMFHLPNLSLCKGNQVDRVLRGGRFRGHHR